MTQQAHRAATVLRRFCAVFGSCVLLAGCASESAETDAETTTAGSTSSTANKDPELQQARTVNSSRHVAERFEEQPVVLDDPHGFVASELFFESSETLILSDGDMHSQLRAASVAAVAHAPMVIYDRDHHNQVIQEIERLGAHTIFAVGHVPVLNYTEDLVIVRDPGGLDALEQATALKFTEHVVETPEEAAAAVAGLKSAEPTWLRAGFPGEQQVPDNAESGTVPLQSRLDAEMAPQVIALRSTPIPAIATARAYGATVTVVPDPDPRAQRQTLLATAGLADKPLVALGREFGTGEELADRITEAEAGALN